jgi:hypothetical protein
MRTKFKKIVKFKMAEVDVIKFIQHSITLERKALCGNNSGGVVYLTYTKEANETWIIKKSQEIVPMLDDPKLRLLQGQSSIN